MHLLLSLKKKYNLLQNVINQLTTKKQLLLVEDNEINQEVAMELLSDLGYEVDVAEHGQNALEILNLSRTKQYDAILMDC